MLAGARVEIAPYKRDAGDFVLWKPSTADLPGWDSPWGRGRPGWHIECSAMIEAIFGETIDLHAGGVDLQFPHHENEIAQSECAHGGKVFARFWLHNGMLNFGGAKMSKSVGNVERVHELLKQHPPEALRHALLSAHYRQPLEWSDALIEQSVRTLDRLYGTLRDLADVECTALIPAEVESALDDDLNTPQALAELARIAGEARKAVDGEAKAHLKSELLGAEDAAADAIAEQQADSGEEAKEYEDAAQNLDRKEVLQARHEVDLQRLAHIERALKKIELGTYGLSDQSGKPIPKERLEASPEAVLTVQEAAATE
jgi:cysteinyl-tRNA synthetase